MASFKNFKRRPGTGGVKIIGLKEIQRSFDKLALKSDDFLLRQIHIAATAIAKRANRDVPVDTGELLGSIKVFKDRSGARVDVRAGYASYVERGTKNMRAQPYIFPNIDQPIKVLIANVKRFITL